MPIVGWVVVAVIIALMVFVSRGALMLMRVLDNPRDARNFRERQPAKKSQK